MEFVNLTPHTINIHNESDELVLTVPPSGKVARVAAPRRQFAQIDGVGIYTVAYGEIEGLPAPQEGVRYITSGLVRTRADRSDVFSPGPLLRDEDGRPMGCIGLNG